MSLDISRAVLPATTVASELSGRELRYAPANTPAMKTSIAAATRRNRYRRRLTTFDAHDHQQQSCNDDNKTTTTQSAATAFKKKGRHLRQCSHATVKTAKILPSVGSLSPPSAPKFASANANIIIIAYHHPSIPRTPLFRHNSSIDLEYTFGAQLPRMYNLTG